MFVIYLTILSMTECKPQPDPFCLCPASEYSWWRNLMKQKRTLVYKLFPTILPVCRLNFYKNLMAILVLS